MGRAVLARNTPVARWWSLRLEDAAILEASETNVGCIGCCQLWRERNCSDTVKNIIICIDGTTNASEVASHHPIPTNVLLFARALLMRDAASAPQIVNYIRGVGTDEAAGAFGRNYASIYGKGLSQIVQNAYEFLTNNYEFDDYVYIFGFSRGAAAARSLSGLTELFGVLPKSVMDRFPIAWDYYNTDPGSRVLNGLRSENTVLGRIAEEGERLRAAHEKECEEDTDGPFGELDGYPHAPVFLPRGESGPLRRGFEDDRYVPMPLHFLGVWDTVFAADSQGFHEQRLAWNVGSAYQALAIHEVRNDFKPELWERKCRHQVVKQTWFTGSHSDVGGGNGNTGLSSTPLEWMIKRVQMHPHVRTGHQIEFDEAYLAQVCGPNAASPLTYPQDEFPYKWRGRSARQMGGMWKGQPLQFRSLLAQSRPLSYHGPSERELDDADKNSKTLPLG